MINTFLSALATTAGITCGLVGVFVLLGLLDRVVTKVARGTRKSLRDRVRYTSNPRPN